MRTLVTLLLGTLVLITVVMMWLNRSQYETARKDFASEVNTVTQLATQTIQMSLQLGLFDPEGSIINSLRSNLAFESGWILDRKAEITIQKFSRSNVSPNPDDRQEILQQFREQGLDLDTHNYSSTTHLYQLSKLFDEDGEQLGFLLLSYSYVPLQERYDQILRSNLIVGISVFLPFILLSIGSIISITRSNSELKHEIAERIKLTESLNESEQRFRNLSELLPVGIVLQQSDGELIFENNYLTELYQRMPGHGDKRQKLNSIKERAGIDDRRITTNWRKLHQLREQISTEIHINSLSDSSRDMWLQITASPIAINSQRCLVCVIRDISERKNQEQELAELNKRMQDLMRDSGRAEVATHVLHNVGNVLNSVNVGCTLLNQKLEQSRLPMALKAQEIILDHNAIKVLQEDSSDNQDRIKTACAYLRKSAEQLTHEQNESKELIHQLQIDIDHIKSVINQHQEDAKAKLITNPYQPRDLFEQAQALAKSAIDTYNISVSLEVKNNLQEIITDKHKALQILVNLIKNACEAMSDSHQRQLFLTCVQTNEHTEFHVQDTGPGISTSSVHKLFQSGYTTKSNGHGFGLHGSANLASEIDGEIDCETGQFEGALFILRLPNEISTISAV